MITPETADRIIRGLLATIADAEIAGDLLTAERTRQSLKQMLFLLGNNHPWDDLH